VGRVDAASLPGGEDLLWGQRWGSAGLDGRAARPLLAAGFETPRPVRSARAPVAARAPRESNYKGDIRLSCRRPWLFFS
jgi:hypothetical protein